MNVKIEGMPAVEYVAAKGSLNTLKLKEKSFITRIYDKSLIIQTPEKQFVSDMKVVKTGPNCDIVEPGDVVQVGPEAIPIVIELTEGNFLLFHEYVVLAAYQSPKDKKEIN